MKRYPPHKSFEKPIFPRWADILSQIVVIYSILTYTLESDPSFYGHPFFTYSEATVVSLFAIEYIARVRFARNRKKYMYSFYGITDLLAILPSIFTLGLIDMRFSRIIRLARLLRILKFVRYSKSVHILRTAFKEIQSELAIFTFTTFVIIYVSAVGIYAFEGHAQPEHFGSISQSLWWGIVTLTTVGYGDVYPITMGGKVFTSLIIFIGLGIVAVPSGLLASSLQSARRNATKQKKALSVQSFKHQHSTYASHPTQWYNIKSISTKREKSRKEAS